MHVNCFAQCEESSFKEKREASSINSWVKKNNNQKQEQQQIKQAFFFKPEGKKAMEKIVEVLRVAASS